MSSKRKIDSISSAGDTKFRCAVVTNGVQCEKTYQTEKWLEEHVFSAHEGGRFKCDEIKENGETCNKKFCFTFYLDDHKKKDCGFTCGVIDEEGQRCTQWAQSKSNITKHRLLHNNERPFICETVVDGEVCGEQFKTDSGLKHHVARVHQRRRDFHCEETKEDGEKCDRSFFDNKDLQDHISAMHLKQKNFVCGLAFANGEICRKSYNNSGSLSKHKHAKHYGKTYECGTVLENGEICK